MKEQQNIIELINNLEVNYLDYTLRRNKQNPEVEQKLIKTISEIARGEKKYPTHLNSELSANNYFTANDYLFRLTMLTTQNRDFQWTEKDELIKGFLNKSTLSQHNTYQQWNLIMNKLFLPAGNPGFESFMEYLHDNGVTDEELTRRLGESPAAAFYTHNDKREVVETCFANYIKTNLKGSSSFLGLKKSAGLGRILDNSVNSENRSSYPHLTLKFLLENSPKSISDYKKYLTKKDYRGEHVNLESVQVLLEHDAQKFESLVYDLLSKFDALKDRFSIHLLLSEKFPKKYHDQLVILGDKILNTYTGELPEKNRYYSFAFEYGHGGPLDIVFSKYLLNYNKELAIERLTKFTRDSYYLNSRFLNLIDKELKEEAVLLLLNSLHKESSIVDSSYTSYFGSLFQLLDTYELSAHTEEIVKFGINNTYKKNKILAAAALKKYVDIVAPRAQQMLEGKVNDRVFGAMILQHSEDKAVRDQLINLIDTERSDDTRDIMLDALKEIKFSKPMNRTEVDDMIAKADARKKLNKWGEKWIDEETLPKLYWKDDDTALTQTDIRFLFYRSKRVKGISSDIEAKQVIELLDPNRSEKFATALIKAYQDSNADTKIKYYLVMAGLIGKDAVLTRIHTVFRSTVTNKRYRMAAMTVGAIAMVGSDKALRIVDMIARKFANKRAQIGKGAKEALTAAANELGITMEQLGDRIIPNLDFEDHYYPFTAGEDAYRAFINKDFKLNYFNEDNKLRKSMPKAVSKETKAELKAIEKEIKEVVKTQQGKLENYLVTERSWEVEEWMEYYMSNPIMLIYVQRLLWGVYDEEHNLMTAFYCDDDLELYDVDDEEVDIEEGKYIKIVHPLHMSQDLLAKWKTKVYDMEKEFEFEVINRTVTPVPADEADRNSTKILHGEDIPKGADYVAGFLLKKGWIKSPSDGGRLEFNKMNEKDKIQAYANIEGPAAWYQGGKEPATIYEVSFYDQVGRKHRPLKEIPKVFFSEVIADLKALINA